MRRHKCGFTLIEVLISVTLLSTITGLNGLDYPADSANEFPAAIVLFESRDALETLGGSTFTGKIKVMLLISSANTLQSYDTLDGYMDPLGTTSIEARRGGRQHLGRQRGRWPPGVDRQGGPAQAGLRHLCGRRLSLSVC